MTKTKIVLDTNILLSNPHFIKENLADDKEFILPIVVLLELSSQKSRGSDISWKSRKVLKALCDLGPNDFVLDETCREIYTDSFYTNDMKIVQAAKKLGATVYSQDKDVIIYSQRNQVPVKQLTPKEIMSMDKDFKGIKWIDMDKATIEEKNRVALMYDSFKKEGRKKPTWEDTFNLFPNEFLVIKTGDKETVYRKREGRMHLVTPYKSDNLSAKNTEQVCALDILMDPKVPVKIITGVAGSGKTYLATNAVLQDLMEGDNVLHPNAKVMFLRNPDGHSDVKEIGYLKGSKEEKMKSFFKPIKDNFAEGKGSFLLEKWGEDGAIEFESPYFIKGRSLQNYSILVDEAEDMTFSTVKLIGTRVGENSSLMFVGK